MHMLETATTGRAKCRACGTAIPKGTRRLGVRIPSPYADGEMTLWFHPMCGALKRPGALLEALDDGEPALAAAARAGVEHERLQRLERAERAPSGQAKCRHCRTAIAKGAWRTRLTFFDEGGRFNPGGFVHLACVPAYCELPPDADLTPITDRLLHFTPDVPPQAVAEIREALSKSS